MQTQTLNHADTFFLISSVGFIMVAALIILALTYVVGILRDVKRITERIEYGIETAGEEVKEFVTDLRESTVFRMIFGGRIRRKNVPRSDVKK